MTIGEKIKKFRTLRGMTQKELGVKVGFKESTAVVRIHQYETNKMKPKSDIRTRIAEELDIENEALNDVEINTIEDIAYLLMELGEKYKLNIHHLEFENKELELFIKKYISRVKEKSYKKSVLRKENIIVEGEELNEYK